MLIIAIVGVEVLVLARRILVLSESAEAAILAVQGTILHGISLVLAMGALEVSTTSARKVFIDPGNDTRSEVLIH
jgi:hypothetical protein